MWWKTFKAPKAPFQAPKAPVKARIKGPDLVCKSQKRSVMSCDTDASTWSPSSVTAVTRASCPRSSRDSWSSASLALPRRPPSSSSS